MISCEKGSSPADRLSNGSAEVPDPVRRQQARSTPARWNGGRYASMHTVLDADYGGGLYGRRKVMVEPVFAQTKQGPAACPASNDEVDPR